MREGLNKIIRATTNEESQRLYGSIPAAMRRYAEDYCNDLLCLILFYTESKAVDVLDGHYDFSSQYDQLLPLLLSLFEREERHHFSIRIQRGAVKVLSFDEHF